MTKLPPDVDALFKQLEHIFVSLTSLAEVINVEQREFAVLTQRMLEKLATRATTQDAYADLVAWFTKLVRLEDLHIRAINGERRPGTDNVGGGGHLRNSKELELLEGKHDSTHTGLASDDMIKVTFMLERFQRDTEKKKNFDLADRVGELLERFDCKSQALLSYVQNCVSQHRRKAKLLTKYATLEVGDYSSEQVFVSFLMKKPLKRKHLATRALRAPATKTLCAPTIRAKRRYIVESDDDD